VAPDSAPALAPNSIPVSTWAFPSLIVTGTPQSVPLTGGDIVTRITCVNDGPFNYPS